MNKCYLDKVCVSVHGINSKQECWPHRQIFHKIYVPINAMPHPPGMGHVRRRMAFELVVSPEGQEI